MISLPRPWNEPPPGQPTAPAAGVDLWLVDAAPPDAAIEQDRQVLSSEELARCDRLRLQEKRSQAIAVRAALRQILGRYLDAAADEMQFAYGEYQKPSLAAPQAEPPLEFNVSHAGVWGIVAVTAGRPVGVDLEEVRPLHNQASFARTILSRAELAYYEAAPPAQRRQFLFDTWSCKEAALKAAGLGLTRALTGVEIAAEGDGRRADIADAPPAARRWRLDPFVPVAGYVAAVATVPAETAPALQFFRWNASGG